MYTSTLLNRPRKLAQKVEHQLTTLTISTPPGTGFAQIFHLTEAAHTHTSWIIAVGSMWKPESDLHPPIMLEYATASLLYYAKSLYIISDNLN